jgi:hypothetical protein
MGLEGISRAKDILESALLDRELDYGWFLKVYPEGFGKVDCQKAFMLACEGYRDNQSTMQPITCAVRKAKALDDHDYLLEFHKKLLHVLRRLKNTEGNALRVQKVRELYEKDENRRHGESHLYRSIIELALIPVIGSSLVEMISKEFKFHESKKEILNYLNRNDKAIHTDAAQTTQKLLSVIKNALSIAELSSKDSLKAGDLLYSLELRVDKLFDNYVSQFMHTSSDFPRDKEKFLQGSFLGPYITISSHCPEETMLFNEVNCCITGPTGKWRDASIIYKLDPSVKVWNFDTPHIAQMGPCNLHVGSPFGLALFIKTAGYHSSNPEVINSYLVIEGFPVNRHYYDRIEELEMVLVRDASYLPLNIKKHSLPSFVYVLGLITAKHHNIPKLFINTEHSGRQESVEDTVGQIAEFVGFKRNDVWKYDKHGKFDMLKDPLTGDFSRIDVGNQRFEYTHLLQKNQLPRQLVEKIRRDPMWSGESVFDTWYGWNKFIMDTYEKWSPQLKKEHPYSESVAKRGKDPQWNLGIGYCKGFEVDVEKECKRLGIS